MPHAPKVIKMKTRNGFTLIELLVVITIISILASMLLPVFAQARKKGQQAVCMSNLRQLGLAVNMYTQDNDEAFPGADWASETGNPGDPNFQIKSGGLYSYLKNDGVYMCRGDQNALIYRVSYEMNEEIMNRSFGAIDDSCSTVLLLDAAVDDCIFSVRLNSDPMPPPETPIPVFSKDFPASNIPNPMNAVHLDVCNTLFADGHVSGMREGRLTVKNFGLF
jgi:prepilin-type N-terminal cleavage/methylation domain-containing protein/prepilin-type processing-associated H-X9-DG protein